MTLQNRVDPWGQLHAVPERGTMMGNRGGKFHRPDQSLGKRRWASTHWICCDIHYKNMKHEAMGQGYTSLFFLDEVTALSAGHRPCFFCRRKEAKAFLSDVKVGAFDARVHRERLESYQMRLFGVNPLIAHPNIPDGTMLDFDGVAYAKRGMHLIRWSFGGYSGIKTKPGALPLIILTPPSIIAILQKGYQPRWHESAYQWD